MMLLSAISNEPDDGISDGSTTGDIADADVGEPDVDVLLRAERSGGGSGRFYTLTYVATDASLNLTQAAASAFVPHDAGGITDPLTLTVEEDGNGMAIQWTMLPEALHYDVIRGVASNIRELESFMDLGPVECLGAGLTGAGTTLLANNAIPPAGEVFFYLVQYNDGISSSYGSESVSKARLPGAGNCPGG
jgi:hypothetical protein